LGDEGPRRDPPHPGPPCRGGLAHGRWLHPGRCREHRSLHRHLRTRRHGYDHRSLRRGRGLAADPVHHRPGARGRARQGGLPGRRHLLDRQAGDEDGQDGARGRTGARSVPVRLPAHALGPSRTGAHRPSPRCAADRDRLRHRHLRAPGAVDAGGHQGLVGVNVEVDLGLLHIEIDFDIDTYEPLAPSTPAATSAQAERILDLIADAEHPLIIAGGGIINAEASDRLVEFAALTSIPVSPTLMGWGAIPDDHELAAGMVGVQTHVRYGDDSFLASGLGIGIGNRWANRHTGDLGVYRKGRKFVHIDIEPTQIGRVFAPDYGVVSDAGAALDALLTAARARAGRLPDFTGWAGECTARKSTEHRKTNFTEVPINPQRVYQEMNAAFGKDVTYVSTIGLSQIAGAQMLHVYKPRHWINAGQAGPLGWTGPAALGVARSKPGETVVALSGDYDFQFMI